MSRETLKQQRVQHTVNEVNTLISETSRINRAKIVTKIALHALRETSKEIIENPLPYVSAAAVAGGYSWMGNGSLPASVLGIGFGVITSKLAEEWQKGPYHA